MRRMSSRTLSIRVASLVGGSLLALALGELALRAAGRMQPDPPWYRGDHVASTEMTGRGVVDETLGWKLAPGEVADDADDFQVVYSIGANGFRTAESEPRPADAPTVVFVGDSFTFGTGVSQGETFAERTAAELGATPINLGMAGFGVDQMWRTLHHHALQHTPDLIVATFVVDDLNRSQTAYRYRNGWIPKPAYVVMDDELVPMTGSHRPIAPLRWFEQRTHLGELARKLSRRLPGGGPRWKLNRAIFAEMLDECRRADVPLVVVHIPHRGHWTPSAHFEREFAAMGLPFLDLGAVPAENPRELYFPVNPHLNARGHAVLAAALADYLRERGLTPD
jgi:hypothetical protein